MNGKMPLPQGVKLIFDKIRSHGHRADIVGGCTRDHLIGLSPSDYDITTDATPDEMKDIFQGMRLIETGIRHGTLTVLLDGEPYEITTYRIDGEYNDHRRPDSVSFTRLLSLDLERRDFTMNAICYNDEDGFTDLFGGVADIDARIIRAVGDPAVRFEEDALRILRAIRFSSVLGFAIDPDTADAAVEKRGLLKSISAERIAVEWRKLLSGKNAYDVIGRYNSIIAEVIPAFDNLTLPNKERFLGEGSPYIRELALFSTACGDGAADAFEAAADSLRYDNRTKSIGVSALKFLDRFDIGTDIGLKRLLMEVGAEAASYVLRIRKILYGVEDAVYERLHCLSDSAVYTLSALAVSGKDLMNIGIFGKDIGVTLNKLLLSVVEERCENDRVALLNLAKELNP